MLKLCDCDNVDVIIVKRYPTPIENVYVVCALETLFMIWNKFTAK